MQKTNRDYPFIYNNEIIEWDIKSANTSLMSYYNLQPDKVIQKLASMTKSQREISVGKLMKKDKEFSIKVIESLCKSEKNKELFKGNDEFEKLYDKYIKKDDLDF